MTHRGPFQPLVLFCDSILCWRAQCGRPEGLCCRGWHGAVSPTLHELLVCACGWESGFAALCRSVVSRGLETHLGSRRCTAVNWGWRREVIKKAEPQL